MKPVRIQRKRTKGWRMPDNTVYVGRGSIWGNPYKVGDTLNFMGIENHLTVAEAVRLYGCAIQNSDEGDYRLWDGVPRSKTIKEKLKGKNLACWCALDKPCHADVLLTLANEEEQHDK